MCCLDKRDGMMALHESMTNRRHNCLPVVANGQPHHNTITAVYRRTPNDNVTVAVTTVDSYDKYPNSSIATGHDDDAILPDYSTALTVRYQVPGIDISPVVLIVMYPRALVIPRPSMTLDSSIHLYRRVPNDNVTVSTYGQLYSYNSSYLPTGPNDTVPFLLRTGSIDSSIPTGLNDKRNRDS